MKKNQRGFFVLIVCVIAAFSAVSCKTAEFGYKVFDINGMIYDFSNRPVAYCEITLGGRGLNSTSDINGRFSIRGVPVGNYALTVQKDGYEKYSEVFFIKQSGQIIYVRLPSQNQLLDLVDEALTANNFILAEEMAERAYRIDSNNIEALFYFATVKYRRRDYDGALKYLEAACDLGSKDPYIDKFMALLKEARNANS
ncbi:MAG: carboxypeptidase regulatory-like domain-containing protein [Treponema sp.]|jgi:hypothetical protein|nr:carboxypeptidase regulatory-like domain-containing protein [Treponema sp.]